MNNLTINIIFYNVRSMGINQVLYNLTALITIVLAFLLFYISISKIDNTVVNKKGGTLELSEVLINYKLPSISVMLIPTLYLFGIIFLLFQVYNGRFAIQEYYNTNINNMILVSVTLVISFVAINYSVNDTDYFVITMKDVIIHKNISKFILYMFLNCFIIFIIVLFHELIPNYVSNIELLITSLYVISLLSLIIFEITVVAKVYNIYYSTKNSGLNY